MMVRVRWFAAGMLVGAGGTLWAERRVRAHVRQAADRLKPAHMADGMTSSARDVQARVQRAIEVGRDERARREQELQRRYGAGRPNLRVASSAGTHARSTPRRRQARR
jgi:hypothetical protein